MGSHARQMRRAHAKRAFKQFKKENPQYKAMRFADYYKLYGSGILSSKHHEDPDVAPAEMKSDDQRELESMILDDDIEEVEQDEGTEITDTQ